MKNNFLEWHAEHGLGSHRTGVTMPPRPAANLSVGNTGSEPDVLMEAAEIMEKFGVNRQRVASIARARKWRYVKVGRSYLYYRVDVQEEAERRIEKGLKA